MSFYDYELYIESDSESDHKSDHESDSESSFIGNTEVVIFKNTNIIYDGKLRHMNNFLNEIKDFTICEDSTDDTDERLSFYISSDEESDIDDNDSIDLSSLFLNLSSDQD